VSTTNCVAVGRYDSTSGGKAIIATDDHGWTQSAVAHLPADAIASADAMFNGVDCVSWGWCVAVGRYNNALGSEGFIETERGGVWGPGVRAPLPLGAVHSTATNLAAVSCITVLTCVAVGQYTSAAGNAPLISWEVNGKWTHARVSPLQNWAKEKYLNQLSGVSCWTWGNCVAVGQFANHTPAQLALIVTEQNGVWGNPRAANLPADAHLDPWAWLLGVSCVTAGNCTAVGAYQGQHHGQGLIVREQGGHWYAGIRAPLPLGYYPSLYSSFLVGVNCVGIGTCSASGYFSEGQNQRGVIIRENGGAWAKAQITPHPANAAKPYYEILPGISCVPGHCVMVGQYQASGGQPAEIVNY
jgi:hypothetical protein